LTSLKTSWFTSPCELVTTLAFTWPSGSGDEHELLHVGRRFSRHELQSLARGQSLGSFDFTRGETIEEAALAEEEGELRGDLRGPERALHRRFLVLRVPVPE